MIAQARPGVAGRTLALLALGVALWVAPATAVRASRGAQTTADEPHYLMTAISLGEDGDLNVADERAGERFREFHEADLFVQAELRDDGSRVSPHDPGLPLLLAIPVRLGGWIAAKLTLALVAGVLAAATAWVAVNRFAVPARVALVTVVAFAAGAPLAVYGTQVYPEIVAALAVTVGIGALTGPPRGRGVVVLALVVVVLPWLAVKYVPVAAALAAGGVVRLVRRGDRGSALSLGGVLAAAGVAYLLAHLAWYGGPTAYAAGTSFTAGDLTVIGHDPDYAGRTIRLAGLLLDRDFGLAAWHPGYLLAAPALGALLAARPRGWVALVAPLAAGWATATWVALTMHGWWFPGRQVVHVLPAAVLVVAWWAARRAAVRAAVVAAGALAASVYVWLVVQGIVGDLTLAVTFESVGHPLVRAWRLLLPDYRADRVLDWALHAAWLAALGGALVLGARAARPGAAERAVAAPGPASLVPTPHRPGGAHP